jgi:hypothetical protein
MTGQGALFVCLLVMFRVLWGKVQNHWSEMAATFCADIGYRQDLVRKSAWWLKGDYRHFFRVVTYIRKLFADHSQRITTRKIVDSLTGGCCFQFDNVDAAWLKNQRIVELVNQNIPQPNDFKSSLGFRGSSLS